MLVYIQVDALQVYAQCGNGTEVSHTADVDTGGTITMLLTFEDFPNITVQSPTARSSRRGSSARASSHLQRLVLAGCCSRGSTGASARSHRRRGSVAAAAKAAARRRKEGRASVLPGDWVAATDSAGRVYYTSAARNTSQWERPTVA